MENVESLHANLTLVHLFDSKKSLSECVNLHKMSQCNNLLHNYIAYINKIFNFKDLKFTNNVPQKGEYISGSLNSTTLTPH